MFIFAMALEPFMNVLAWFFVGSGQDFADDYNEESESDDEAAESDDETAESEAEEETDANNDEEGSSEAKVEGSDDEERYLEISKEVLKKLGADIEDIEKVWSTNVRLISLPYHIHFLIFVLNIWQRMSGQLLGSSEVPKAIAVDHSDKAKRPLKKGSQLSARSPAAFALNGVCLSLSRVFDVPSSL